MVCGISCFSQNELVQTQLENFNRIQNAQDFNILSSSIKELSFQKKEDYLWSPQLLSSVESAKDWAEKQGTAQEILLANHYILLYYDNHLKDDLVISIGENLILDPIFMEMPESVRTLLALNFSYGRKGFYQQQLNSLNTLIAQNEKFNYIVRPSTYGYFNELALVYYNLGQYNLARNNFKKQAEVFRNAKDVFRTSSMLNNIGLTYAKQQKPDSALIYYKQTMLLLGNNQITDDYYSSEYIQHFKNVVKSNIVKVDSSGSDFFYAKRVFKNELASSKAVKELRTTAQAYQNIANLYFQNKDFDLAKLYIDSTLAFEKTFHNPVNREEAYLLKAKILLIQNDSKGALRYFDLNRALSDSLNRAKEEKDYAEATAKYNFIKTGEALDENRKLLQQREEANFVQLVFLCVVILLGLFIGFLLFKSIKANRLIANQKDELQKGLKEKGIMMDEIHHRIKNNLQVVSGILELQRGKIDSEKHAKIYEESQAYLQSMSMIHELLYEQEGVSKLDMQAYLMKLGHLLIDSYPNIKVGYNVAAPTVQLEVKNATPLALIICELITNSLKHAFKETGEIKINLTKNGKNYELVYADNGSGFNNINDSTYYNTGLNLIIMLTEDLNGKVVFSNNNGFRCLLTFTD